MESIPCPWDDFIIRVKRASKKKVIGLHFMVWWLWTLNYGMPETLLHGWLIYVFIVSCGC
jgi:hypothetical protein